MVDYLYISRSASERREFSLRLRNALSQVGESPAVANVTSGFNHSNNDLPVTSHSVRKWLTGEAIPTQPKLRCLAAWLGVSAAWLRFGDDAAVQAADNLSAKEQALIAAYRNLSSIEKSHLLNLIRAIAAEKIKK